MKIDRTNANKFRLMGSTLEFYEITRYKAAGFIPSVIGVANVNGVWVKTNARVADTIPLN